MLRRCLTACSGKAFSHTTTASTSEPLGNRHRHKSSPVAIGISDVSLWCYCLALVGHRTLRFAVCFGRRVCVASDADASARQLHSLFFTRAGRLCIADRHAAVLLQQLPCGRPLREASLQEGELLVVELQGLWITPSVLLHASPNTHRQCNSFAS